MLFHEENAIKLTCKSKTFYKGFRMMLEEGTK
jgi:hypothetical protein